MITAVTYDLDGTLIDSTDAIVHCFMRACDDLGLARPPREDVVGTIGHILEDQFRLLTEGDPVECAKVYREHYEEFCRPMTTLLPGARESLERVRQAGLRIGFASSKRRRFCELILEHLGVLDYFELRLGPDDVAHPKPHPEAVLKALEYFGVAPGEMFFIGDTHFDVMAARNAGVPCLCVATGYNTREELEALRPEGVFDNLHLLTDYLLSNRDRRREAGVAEAAGELE
jgi:2-phosphoglycolate phosphatase